VIAVYKNYVKALCEIVVDLKKTNGSQSSFVSIRNEIQSIIQVVLDNPTLKKAFESPVVTQKEKQAIMQKICKNLSISPLIENTFVILAKKNRIVYLDKFLDVFDQIVAETEGRLLGKVVSAQPLSQADIESISSAFEKKLSKKVSFSIATDSKLIAGVKVTVGGITYDRTLKTQISRFRDSIVEAIQ